MTNKLLTIDPAAAKPHAYALWRDRRLAECGFVTPAQMWLDCNRVVVESQFAGRNGAAAIALAQAAGNAVGLHCRLACGQVEWVQPVTWKNAVCRPQGITTKKPTTRRGYDVGYGVELALHTLLAATEIRLLEQCLRSTGDYQRRMDVIDAVGIGVWALDRCTPK